MDTEILINNNKANSVVILAGGLGMRLRPLTEKIPKPLLNIGSKPILEIIINRFSSFGFKNIHLAVNYKAQMIKDYFGNGEKFGVSINYLHEEERLGTAGPLSLLDTKNTKEPIFVMNGDVLTNINFESFLYYHKMLGASASIAVKDYEYQIPYGVINMMNNYSIDSISEKPSLNFFVNAGIYILNPELLNLIVKNKYLDMPDFINELREKNHKITSFPIHERYMDIGRLEEYEKANIEFEELIK